MSEAEARCQPFPSPNTAAHKAPIASRIDTSIPAQDFTASAAPMAMMISPTEGAEDSTSSTPKKRGRPPKAFMDAKKLELGATAIAAGGSGEGIASAQEVIKETQQSDIAAPDSLVVAMP